MLAFWYTVKGIIALFIYWVQGSEVCCAPRRDGGRWIGVGEDGGLGWKGLSHVRNERERGWEIIAYDEEENVGWKRRALYV